MTSEEREQLRLSLVRHLVPGRVLRRFGLSTALLVQYVRSEGTAAATADLVEVELEYLASRGLVEIARKSISPENRSWKLTAAGRDFAAEGGLE